MAKKGFSLMEALLTMVIIGFVAAIVTPMLVKSSPDKNKVMFRKAYNVMLQGVSNLINDDTNYPATQVDITTGYQNGFNYTTATSNTSNKFCYFLTDSLNTIGSVTCPSTSAATNAYFTTSDGIVWTIDFPSGGTDAAPNTQFPLSLTSYSPKFVVDVDGTSKGPNCSTDDNATSYTFGSGAGTALTRCSWYASCTAGTANPQNTTPDRYIIGIRFDGKLQVGSGSSTDDCANNILLFATTNTNG